MTRRPFITAAAIAALLAAAMTAAMTITTATAAAATDTLLARLWSTEENTRLVLESDTRLIYAVSDLDNPPRLIIDIKSATADAKLINQLTLPQQSYLHRVRAGRHDSDTMRIVFDLSAAVHYRIHRLAPIERYLHRLVIDVSPQVAVAADPLRALLERLESERQQDAPPPPDGAAPFVVMIDPGHGGEDPGAVSPNNNYEKNLVLKISHLLAREINAHAGMTAVMTRSDDRFIPLFERVRIAHRRGADAFLSIHADSVKSRKPRGSSVFILSKKGASSKFARQLARQENLSDVIGGQPSTSDPNLLNALRAFTRDGKERASRQLARLILDNLSQINRLHSKRVESAGFAVLKSPSIPSVLVETAFISNPVEEKKLLSPAFQQQLAKQIAAALNTYHRQHHVLN